MTDWLGPNEWAAVLLSIKVAFWATLLSLPVAMGIAYLLAKKEFVGKQLLNGIVHLPLILPPVVTGYLLLMTLVNAHRSVHSLPTGVLNLHFVGVVPL